MKRIVALILSFTFLFLFTSCRGELSEYRPITDVNNLDGRRVGCVVGWETDYILTPRDDLTLRRYDAIGDMVMALCYKQLDAIAVDEETSKLVLSSVEGVELVEPSIDKIGYTLLAYNTKSDLVNEFNTWFADFINTDDYKAYEERNHSYDGITFESLEIAEAKNPTKVLNVGYTELYYPCAFTNNDGVAQGTDLEILKYFGRDCGYKVNFVSSSESAVGPNLQSGKLDFYAGGLTDVYREEYEGTGVYLMSDAYRFSYVYLIQVNDWDKLSMKSAIEE